jgi:hypothetical protein
VLDMDLRDIQGQGRGGGVPHARDTMKDDLLDDDALLGFKDTVACDVAHAVAGRRDKVQVLGLRAGSVVVSMALLQGVCGRTRRPLECAYMLQQQSLDPDSTLKQVYQAPPPPAPDTLNCDFSHSCDNDRRAGRVPYTCLSRARARAGCLHVLTVFNGL